MTGNPAVTGSPVWPRTSLVEVLEIRAQQSPVTAIRFMTDGTDDSIVDWTYRDVADHAAVVATDLVRRGLAGKRVVLALDPGLHYIAALFGIFQSGATAVPSYPPTGRRMIARFLSIVTDCEPAAIIADVRYKPWVREFEDELPHSMQRPRWIFVDDAFFRGHAAGRGNAAVADGWSPEPGAPALLQYTSGSTGRPKGIILTHDNLTCNNYTIERTMGDDPDRIGVSWLPPYHDMGLMGTIMPAIFGGWPFVLMSPVHFIQHPFRWLKAISDHGASISVAPNFAFELCVDTVTDEELATLDLSRLRQVFCGSEPVVRSTHQRFLERFGPRGYSASALIPCYGMAEATLFVSGKAADTPVRTEWLDKSALEQGRAVRRDGAATAKGNGESNTTVPVVSCGRVAVAHDVRIVDPRSRRPVPDGTIGEIWVHGPNVASGYFERPDQTAETFGARLADAAVADREYLRTGDLGFLMDGELFVTGRLKDVIIIAGRNLYPQDIELSVHRAHDQLRRAAAFSVGGGATEELVVVVEFAGTAQQAAAEAAEVRDAVVAAVTADHGVRPADVYVGPFGTVPVTTSGKVQRNATRNAYRSGTLKKAVAG